MYTTGYSHYRDSSKLQYLVFSHQTTAIRDLQHHVSGEQESSLRRRGASLSSETLKKPMTGSHGVHSPVLQAFGILYGLWEAAGVIRGTWRESVRALELARSLTMALADHRLWTGVSGDF